MNFLNALSQVSDVTKNPSVKQAENPQAGADFLSVLKGAVEETNDMQKTADLAASSIATGSVKDLHQAAIAIDKAEINMKMMLEIRNKALSAYKDILRTQV